MTRSKVKHVYVLSREHYRLPPNESDMVASIPIEVRAGTDTGRISLKTEAKKLAQELCGRYGGELKEHTSVTKEYRVWVDSSDQNCPRFVYVVRRVYYIG